MTRPYAAAQVSGEIEHLIDKGMRARLTRTPPLIGRYGVSLQTVPGTPAPRGPPAAVDGMPQIPVAPGSDITTIVNRINRIPLGRIAQNVLDMTHHGDTLASSPKLRDAIVQLDAALRQIHQATSTAGPQIGPLVRHLRLAANDLDGTAKSAKRLMSGTATQNGLENTVQEITEAARAARSLADYLDRHSEALIRGRGGKTP